MGRRLEHKVHGGRWLACVLGAGCCWLELGLNWPWEKEKDWKLGRDRPSSVES